MQGETKSTKRPGVKKRFIINKRAPFYGGTNRIFCPVCGNDEDFWEHAEGVTIKTRYIQNEDGSFTPVADDTQVFGEIKFICGKCGADLSEYHKQFLEMLF
ncbi:hypothetical protein [Thermodesulfatator atlanticus]|uniref:hypothetical protein n=1 Tax=Thermodesulfatator atlanticus TaxID=501497 RepID=UPI0003B60B13|nr:hypothetical protein [Thermodesulfatator atlanticus]